VGVKRSRSTPGAIVTMRLGSASYSCTSSSASSAVEAISRSAVATTCASPMARALGSGVSPSARVRFLTFASVWLECTIGTPQRSFASQATWPESQ
jgi:hypothetical protein